MSVIPSNSEPDGPMVRPPRAEASAPRAGAPRRSGFLALGWIFWLGWTAWGPSPLPAQSPATESAADALRILESAADRFAALPGFCAEFRQEIRNDILRQNTRSRGELCQSRPDRFSMHFSDPAGDLVVADGRDIWIYFPSTDPGQAFRTSMTASEGRFDLHREFLEEPGDRYAPTLEGTEEIEGRPAYRLALVPLRPSPYLRARIWVDQGDRLLRRVEITEDDGLVRILDLSDLRVREGMDPERFRFLPPEGVQVIVR